MDIRLRDRIKFAVLFYKALSSLDSEHITVNVIYSDYGEYTMAVTKPDSEPDHVSRMFG
jgi:hypothetical protein